MKHSLIRIFFFCISLSIWNGKLYAQNDPVLAGMIVSYTNKAKSQFKAQTAAMALQSTGHIWTKEEVKATNSTLTVYREYLDSFRDIIAYAGQTYGFYLEVKRLVENINDLNQSLSANSEGGFATVLSQRKSKIFRNVILNSVGVVNDIRNVCLGNSKMTEKERISLVFSIRPKLKEMNSLLRKLTLSVKYSSMYDVWLELGFDKPKTRSKEEIARECLRSWRNKPKVLSGN